MNDNKTKLERDIETAIRVLRFMTCYEGIASIEVYDTGAGGGFQKGTVIIELLRSGLHGKKEVYSVEDLKQALIYAANAYNLEIHELDAAYRATKWNN